MYRSNTCGELRLSDAGKEVTLAGWVQRSRKMGGMTFVDLRDRYGITQLVFNEADNKDLCDAANKLGREFCIQIKGVVSERQSKNPKMDTGDIEILVTRFLSFSSIKLFLKLISIHLLLLINLQNLLLRKYLAEFIVILFTNIQHFTALSKLVP